MNSSERQKVKFKNKTKSDHRAIRRSSEKNFIRKKNSVMATYPSVIERTVASSLLLLSYGPVFFSPKRFAEPNLVSISVLILRLAVLNLCYLPCLIMIIVLGDY